MAENLRYFAGMQDNDNKQIKSDETAARKAARVSEAERQAQARRERAAKTLRDNLLKRKQQGRARRAGSADETSGLPAAKMDESGE